MNDKAFGCLVGVAIGDAMGMPASFMTPQEIRREYGRIEGFLKPTEAQVAHGSLEAGEVTDDTEETLLIADVLLTKGGFDEGEFVRRVKRWAQENRMLESTVIGPTTRRFLEAILSGGDHREAGRIGDTNGAAMRVAPVGLFYAGDPEAAVRAAIASALPSHGSCPAAASAAAVAAAIAVCAGPEGSVNEAIEAAIRGAAAGEEAGFDIPAPSVLDRIRLARRLVDDHRTLSLSEQAEIIYRHIGASMKSYESIPFSLGVFYAAGGDFRSGLTAAINIGDDADTNGAIVGGLCGAFTGAAAMPAEWIAKVTGTNDIDLADLADRLVSAGPALRRFSRREG